ncbi:hypothetical protein [Desertivirga brevis]|uniref:hypothetical protein n=1 Tax=Desertivirga brevis TaxID=2810310 RepID=UPI001A958F04|nr:hypothetical protein [Pedobacter sp. SYSU D00873]
MIRKFLYIVLFIGLSLTLKGQTSARQQLDKYQDSLVLLGKETINNTNEAERYKATYKMVKILVKALKVPGSFNYGFDSLKTVTIQRSPDNKFKTFTWHVMNDDGSYRYYGTIQMNSPQGLKLFPLVDNTAVLKRPQDTVLTNDKWYGSQYYKIIPVVNSARQPYYVLLGWKGNTPKSTKKVIEILYFKNNKAYFGLPVFDGNKEYAGKNRIIFEYSRQASMILNYNPQEGTIVFDHLAAPDPKLKDKPELYGPDLSYDGLKLLNGRWRYVADLPLKNAPSENDNQYNDPKKPAKGKSERLVP